MIYLEKQQSTNDYFNILFDSQKTVTFFVYSTVSSMGNNSPFDNILQIFNVYFWYTVFKSVSNNQPASKPASRPANWPTKQKSQTSKTKQRKQKDTKNINPLGPKYSGILGINAQGSRNQTAWSLQWVIYYTVKQHLETMLYKPLFVRRVLCIRWSVAVDPLSATAAPLHLTQFAVPFVQIVTTVCLQGTWFYTIFCDTCNAWYMVLGPWVDLIQCSLNQSPHLTIWLRKVGLLSRQSEPWVDVTCSLKIEHPGCAENQALANHRCSVEHILLHALVKYTIQLALQNTFSYTWYNHVFWALAVTFTT